jgi:hypothetical protein
LVAPRIRKGLSGLGRVTPARLVAFLRRSMGGVRPSLRPRDSPLALRAGLPAQHGPACGPGGRYPLAPGAATRSMSSCVQLSRWHRPAKLLVGPNGNGPSVRALADSMRLLLLWPQVEASAAAVGHLSRQEGPSRPPRCCHPRTISAKHQSPRISGALSDEPLPVLLSEQLRWPYRRIFLGFVVAHGHGLARVGRASG